MSLNNFHKDATTYNNIINVKLHTIISWKKFTISYLKWGWLGGAMVLGKLPVPGRPTVWT